MNYKKAIVVLVGEKNSKFIEGIDFSYCGWTKQYVSSDMLIDGQCGIEDIGFKSSEDYFIALEEDNVCVDLNKKISNEDYTYKYYEENDYGIWRNAGFNSMSELEENYSEEDEFILVLN